MKKQDYYNLMCNFDSKSDFEKLHKEWFQCFDYIMRVFKVGHNSKTIKSLFYNFDMDNWTALHKEKTEYKDYTREKLIKSFCSECSYISDRVSYDRLFRTHWLFRQAFEKEMMNDRWVY